MILILFLPFKGICSKCLTSILVYLASSESPLTFAFLPIPKNPPETLTIPSACSSFFVPII